MAAMRRVLTSDEAQARDRIVALSEAAGRAIEQALRCFRDHDTVLAREVVDRDADINELQRKIEEGCFAAIALQQPVASDLRDLVSDMNIAGELERIADHAADIAKIVVQMDAAPLAAFAGSIERLGEECRRMLAAVIRAYQERDERRARAVAAEDDGVDRLEQQITADILTYLSDNPDQIRPSTHALWVAHNIERIGDRVTNIAERVVFMTTGQYADLNR
jgi:phosphate transport system protein